MNCADMHYCLFFSGGGLPPPPRYALHRMVGGTHNHFGRFEKERNYPVRARNRKSFYPNFTVSLIQYTKFDSFFTQIKQNNSNTN